MRVVGIDQSYTGFGYCVNGEAIKKGFPAKDMTPCERLLQIENWLTLQLEKFHFDVDLVVMEGYANAAKFGREMAGELGWAVKRTIFATTGTDPLIVPPTSLKKFVTGKGNAKKNEMLLGVYKKWGQQFADDNQADAFALEMFGHAYLNIGIGTGGYTKYEQEAVEAVRKAK